MATPKSLTIALAGNPNAGKTTIFNGLTGTRQKVGNWPGVTVEKKEGVITRDGYRLRIIDLPGIYSITPYSIEEIVTRDYILDAKPDVVIDIIDATNLERSLYLATQLREIDCKVVLALNMADLAKARGIKINAGKLAELLELPVVFTVGNKSDGLQALLDAAIQLAETGSPPPQKRRVRYNQEVESAISRLMHRIAEQADNNFPYNPRWAAIKLLENDLIVHERIEQFLEHGEQILHDAATERQHLIDRFDDDPEIVLTDERYGFIAGIVREVHTTSTRQRVDISRNIDRVLTNRFIGFPIFIGFIWAMFQLTFTLGEWPMAWIESGISTFSHLLGLWLPDSIFKSLLIDGVVAGVGSVIVFLPNILILFFCIALFEDTGYMARAAFLMDKIMHLIGLHGKSFIPMLMGFGCNVPAVMATRTLESEKDRILTILITPFMSCSAKLPVYIVLAGAFFGARAGTVIFGIYLLGIILSIVTGRIFRSTLLRGEDAPFVMELPPYRVPMFKSLMIHMWDRSKIFLKKMGGLILIGSIIIWALSNFPRDRGIEIDYRQQAVKAMSAFEAALAESPADELASLRARYQARLAAIENQRQSALIEHSLIGRIGHAVAPVFEPLGIDWRGGVALLTGFVAKEIVVSTLGVLHSIGEDSDENAMQQALVDSGMTPLAALAMMAFVLLYMPCLATVSAIRRETHSWRWMTFNIVYSTGMAWVVAFVIYQGGRLIGVV
jgi:ferrous iron transport protein B